LRERLEPLRRKTQPYAKRVAHKGIWVEPKLLAEIEYRAKSAERCGTLSIEGCGMIYNLKAMTVCGVNGLSAVNPERRYQS
jgi:hypothetical protein